MLQVRAAAARGAAAVAAATTTSSSSFRSSSSSSSSSGVALEALLLPCARGLDDASPGARLAMAAAVGAILAASMEVSCLLVTRRCDSPL
jgi:hypothetical protein